MTVTTAVVVLPRRMAGWATRRALARNSLSGIGLACAVCAAVWFSGGTPPTALAGGLALGAGYLARRVGRQLVATDFERWMAGACALTGELAVYAGLAAGASDGYPDVWLAAISAALLLALRKEAWLCGAPWPAVASHPRPGAPAGTSMAGPGAAGAGNVLPRLLALPAGERAVLITGTAAIWGGRITLLVLTWWGTLALVWAMAQARAAGSATQPGPPGQLTRPGLAVDEDVPGVAACRDDGPIARFAGQIVRGQLVPLPPAVAGLAATLMLALLGLGSLPAILLLAPVVAMMLAAPGSAHPHRGPADWVTPLVLQAGEYVYLVALGFAKSVPAPVTFGMVGVVALWHLDVAYRARQRAAAPRAPAGTLQPGTGTLQPGAGTLQPGTGGLQPGEGAPRRGMGWEGRMLAAGIGAMLGLTLFAYLALAAYLGLLLSWSSLSSWFALREGARG